MSNRDPLNQLAAFRLEAEDVTRARDLEAIRAELRRHPPVRSKGRRRWTLGVVVAVMLAGPTAAIASDDAVPGDLLYPVKRAVEPIVQLFDRDVAVEHRVEEVAVLVDRDTTERVVEERIDIARDALAENDVPRLRQELDRIVDRWVADQSEPSVTDLTPSTTAPVREDTRRDRGERERDDREPTEATSTTVAGDRPADRPSVTTTTMAAERTDGQPADDRPADDRPRDTP